MTLQGKKRWVLNIQCIHDRVNSYSADSISSAIFFSITASSPQTTPPPLVGVVRSDNHGRTRPCACDVHGPHPHVQMTTITSTNRAPGRSSIVAAAFNWQCISQMETDSRLHFAVSLVILIALTDIGPTVGQTRGEADRIRMEDPCAMELQLQQGTRSNNLACPVDQSPIMESRCFNITDICDGQQFCSNGDDEGQGSPPGIECGKFFYILDASYCAHWYTDTQSGTNSTKFACSSNESIGVMQICDGNKDCSRGEDEHFKLCRSEGKNLCYNLCSSVSFRLDSTLQY